jgi:hypothetical protein
VNPVDGTVGVVYHDRSYSDEHTRYDTTLSESPAGGTDFNHKRVTTARSAPRNSVFFQADTPGCRHCATFHGDYIGLAYGVDGKANMVWTDMRDFDSSLNGYLQFIYFGQQ